MDIYPYVQRTKSRRTRHVLSLRESDDRVTRTMGGICCSFSLLSKTLFGSTESRNTVYRCHHDPHRRLCRHNRIKVTVAGAIRRLRAAGRLDTIGDLVPGETNELTSGTIIDIGGVQVKLTEACCRPSESGSG